MNIAVLSASGRVFVRPDTTWERYNRDFFVPEFIDSISFTPVLFARVCRPGKSISSRFAGRYFDGAGFGVLLYPETLIDGSEEGFACASCIDHTSFLPFPVPGRREEYGDAVVSVDGATMTSCKLPGDDSICAAIEKITHSCLIRTGDVIAVELQERRPLCSRTDGRVTVRMESEITTGDFSVIF